jgi:hypothetical protein
VIYLYGLKKNTELAEGVNRSSGRDLTPELSVDLGKPPFAFTILLHAKVLKSADMLLTTLPS